MDYSPPGSSVHGILQARIVEWVVISFSPGSTHPEIKPKSLAPPALEVEFFTTSSTWEAQNSIICQHLPLCSAHQKKEKPLCTVK